MWRVWLGVLFCTSLAHTEAIRNSFGVYPLTSFPTSLIHARNASLLVQRNLEGWSKSDHQNDALFCQSNASLHLHAVHLAAGSCHLARICSRSVLSLSAGSLLILHDPPVPAFDCSGTIALTNVHFVFMSHMRLVSSLFSLSREAHVSLCLSSFPSFCLAHKHLPLLGFGKCASIQASLNSFSNISTLQRTGLTPHHTSQPRFGSMLVTGCTFEGVGDALAGSILSSGAPHTLLELFNTSLFRCGNSENNDDSECPTQRDTPSSGTNNYIRCTFLEFRDNWGVGGGALRVSGAASVTVDSCTFIRCCTNSSDESGSGGGVYFTCSGSQSLINSTFDECQAGYVGGGFRTDYGTCQFCIGVKCVNCTSAHYSGGCMCRPPQESCMVNSSFRECEATNYCSAFVIHTSSFPVTITECECTMNTAPYSGTLSVLFRNPSLKGLPLKRLAFCWFEANTIARSDDANDVYFDNQNAADYIDHPEVFIGCYSMSSLNHLFFQGPGGMNDWIPFLTCQGPIMVDFGSQQPSPATSDHPKCGNPDDMCKTIGFGISLWNPHPNQTIQVLSSQSLEKEWNIDDRRIVITHAPDDEPNTHTLFIQTDPAEPQTSFCSIASGSLSLSNSTITHSSENVTLFHISSAGTLSLTQLDITSAGNTFSSPLFLLSGGTSFLNSVSIQSLTFAECSMLCFGKDVESIQLTSTPIAGANRLKGNGGGISGIVGSGKEITLANQTIHGCACSDGNGGGLHIQMEEGSRFCLGDITEEAGSRVTSCTALNIEGGGGGHGGGLLLRLNAANNIDFSIINVDFSACQALFGHSFFISAQDLKRAVESAHFTDTFTNESKDLHMGSEATDYSFIVPLVVFFWPPPQTVLVGGDNNMDFSVCGFDQYPCRSVDYALNLRFSHGQSTTMALASSAQITSPFVFSFPFLIHPRDQLTTQEILIHDSGSDTLKTAYLRSESNTTATMCTFCIQQQLSESRTALFESADGTLSLHDCSIINHQEPGKKCRFSFFVLSGGCLVSSRFTTANFVFHNSSVVSLLSFTNTVQLVNWTIQSVAKEEGNGSVISGSVPQGGKVVFSGEGISKCEAMKGSGGGLWLVMEKDSSVRIGNETDLEVTTRLAECEARLTEGIGGYGGALCLTLKESAADFKIANLDFTKCQAHAGKNLFVQSDDLSTIVDRIHFLLDLSAMEEEDMMGWEGSVELYSIPLVFYFRQPSHPLLIAGTNARDFSRCGYPSYPCQTITQALSLYVNATGFRMSVSGATSITAPAILLGDKVEISGVERPHNVSLSPTASVVAEAFVQTAADTSLTNLSFVFPSSFAHTQSMKALLRSSSKIGLCNSSFQMTGQESPLHFSLVSITAGELCISECTISAQVEQLVFSDECSVLLVSPTDTAVIIKGLAIANASFHSGSIVSFDTGISSSFVSLHTLHSPRPNTPFSLSAESSHFDGILGSADKPCVFSCAGCAAEEITISGCVLNACSSSKSKRGGGVCVDLADLGTLTIADCKLTTCAASTAEMVNRVGGGRGGFLHLNCTGNNENGTLLIAFLDLFFNNNSATVGRDLFIECASLVNQLNESHFRIDLTPAVFNRSNALFGSSRSALQNKDIDLLQFMEIYQSDTIFVSTTQNATTEKVCGKQTQPCASFSLAIAHLVDSFEKRLIVDTFMILNEAVLLSATSLKGKEGTSTVQVHNTAPPTTSSAMLHCVQSVRIEQLTFSLPSVLQTQFTSLIASSGRLSIHTSSFSSPTFFTTPSQNDGGSNGCAVLEALTGTLEIANTSFSSITAGDRSLITIHQASTEVTHLILSSCSFTSVASAHSPSVLDSSSPSVSVQLSNCSCASCSSLTQTGSIVAITDSINVSFTYCSFSGQLKKEEEEKEEEGEEEQEEAKNVGSADAEEEICSWSGSLLHLIGCTASFELVTVANASKGGLSIGSSTALTVLQSEFSNNNPNFSRYPSFRRNILCQSASVFKPSPSSKTPTTSTKTRDQLPSSQASPGPLRTPELNIVSLKGGDGTGEDKSLWITGDGPFELRGIPSRRQSPFFIPTLENVSLSEDQSECTLHFNGSLLLPCGISFAIVVADREGRERRRRQFLFSHHLNETTAVARVQKQELQSDEEEGSVRIVVLFEAAPTKDQKETQMLLLHEGQKPPRPAQSIALPAAEGKTSWIVVVAVLAALNVAVTALFVAVAVRSKRAKHKLNHPSLFVKDVELESSQENSKPKHHTQPPHPQLPHHHKGTGKGSDWYSDEDAASSQDALLGKDERDENKDERNPSEMWVTKMEDGKIIIKRGEENPQKSDQQHAGQGTTEENSAREQPSAHTEVLRAADEPAPTSSSIDNLVEGISCESPFEKVIVDTRDSLYQRLHHGDIHTEKAISQNDRIIRACRTLYWVINGLEHILDTNTHPPILRNLSSRAVMFGEEGSVCLGDTAQLQENDRRIKERATATGSGDKTRRAAGEGGECGVKKDADLEVYDNDRWKALELLANKAAPADQKTAVFAVGMLLYEMITGQVPFHEIDPVSAALKILTGERPSPSGLKNTPITKAMQMSWSHNPNKRPSLAALKRVLLSHLPEGSQELARPDPKNHQTQHQDPQSQTKQDEAEQEHAEESQQ